MTRIEHVNFGWLYKPPLPLPSHGVILSDTESDLVHFGYHDIAELPGTIPMLEDVA